MATNNAAAAGRKSGKKKTHFKNLRFIPGFNPLTHRYLGDDDVSVVIVFVNINVICLSGTIFKCGNLSVFWV